MTTTPTEPTAATDLPSQYQPVDVEKAINAKWNAAKAWHAESGGDKPPYSVVIPPPNVTAALHLGHALNNTLQDVLVRYHRMAGFNAMWMPGTDHAGIATQTVVDKRLQASGQKALKDYKLDEAEGRGGREAFIGKVTAWKDEYEARITEQLREMGCSCDWDRQRFTMDETCAAAVREAFFQLFKDGLIYRGKRLVNWDPVTQTALADDEVEMQDINGNFYYMKYPIVEADGTETGDFVTVATTRPETMLGDTAVAVNPNDEKNKWTIGKLVKLPIVGRVVPVIGDDYVVIPDEDSDDGKAKMASGFLKVTPAHDPNDYEIGQRHHLGIINVMAPDGSISKDHGWEDWDACDADAIAPFLGLSREEARKAIVRWFKERDLLPDMKPYRHAVGHSYRSHVPVEPYLSDQWYVKVTDDRLAGAALRAMDASQRVEGTECSWTEEHPFDAKTPSGQDAKEATGLVFTPPRYAKTFQNWHENIRDWCISRQLWWGHRIPVWSLELAEGAKAEDLIDTSDDNLAYNIDGDRIFVCVRQDNDALSSALANKGFTQDPDVLDTWFSSALWPMSTMGWPQETPELETWNPTNVLCTAREIITLWVSRMTMFNIYFKGRLPFKDVFIHAMIQDGHGQKMSKSLGNGVDPMDIIHSHGSDAMRFTLASMTTHTQDVRMPVDCVDPHTGEAFMPKFTTASGGYKVAAPVQEHGGKQCVSSYGIASGHAEPTDDMPAARNTSEKFDLGQRFANKLWNATRFALGNLSETAPADFKPLESLEGLDVASRWILSRLNKTIAQAEKSLKEYSFADFATCLYDFVWRDLCDWYIEAIKPTVKTDAAQQQVLAACFDASLRLLHPSMPFITERLWEALNATAPARGVPGLELPAHDMLMTAAWPTSDGSLDDATAEGDFELVQSIVSATRSMRQTHKVPPRQEVEISIKASAAALARLKPLHATAMNLSGGVAAGLGEDTVKPDDAAATLVGEIEVYVHGLVDSAAETERLQKRLDELNKRVANFEQRLGNKNYVDRAPEKLVNETREQYAAAQKERDAVQTQLDALK